MAISICEGNLAFQTIIELIANVQKKFKQSIIIIIGASDALWMKLQWSEEASTGLRLIIRAKQYIVIAFHNTQDYVDFFGYLQSKWLATL